MSKKLLDTPQQVWDYYCEVNNLTNEGVGDEAASWISNLLADFNDEEFHKVIRNSIDAPAYALFDKSFFQAKLETIKAREEVKKAQEEIENMKSVDRTAANSLDLLTKTVAQTMTGAVKDLTFNQLKEDFKNWVVEAYGPTFVMPKQYATPKGEPIQGVVNKKFPNIVRKVVNNTPVLLKGPAGSGKNFLIQQVGEHLGYPIVVLPRVQDAAELCGYRTVDGEFAITPFIHFVRKCNEDNMIGIVVFDEIDGSEANAMVAINDCLESHKLTLADTTTLDLTNIKFVACANTWGTGATDEYVGRNQLDGATLDRFMPVVVDYDDRVEKAICPNEELLELFREFRNAVRNCGINHIVSYRGLKALYKDWIYEEANNNLTEDVIREILQEDLIKNLGVDDLLQIYTKMKKSNLRNVIQRLAEVY